MERSRYGAHSLGDWGCLALGKGGVLLIGSNRVNKILAHDLHTGQPRSQLDVELDDSVQGLRCLAMGGEDCSLLATGSTSRGVRVVRVKEQHTEDPEEHDAHPESREDASDKSGLDYFKHLKEVKEAKEHADDEERKKKKAKEHSKHFKPPPILGKWHLKERGKFKAGPGLMHGAKTDVLKHDQEEEWGEIHWRALYHVSLEAGLDGEDEGTCSEACGFLLRSKAPSLKWCEVALIRVKVMELKLHCVRAAAEACI